MLIWPQFTKDTQVIINNNVFNSLLLFSPLSFQIQNPFDKTRIAILITSYYFLVMIILRMGGFYIGENVLLPIGFFVNSSGIEDILDESGNCLRGIGNKVVSGRNYYNMILYYSLVCEAVLHLQWNAMSEQLRLDVQDDSLIDLEMHLHDLLEAVDKHDAILIYTN